MKKYFLDLFEYNNWANDRIIINLQHILKDLKETKPLLLMSHIISSQETWLERVKSTKTYNIFLWDEYSLQELEVLSMNNYKAWIKFISSLEENDFESLCNYKNSKGKKFSKIYRDIFQHIINHSSYHRGQINQYLSMNNFEPVVTDFIYYC